MKQMNYNFTADGNTEINDLIIAIEDAIESDVKILFQKNATLYLKSLNLKILQKLASEKSKTVTFDVENKSHKDYIDAVNGDFMQTPDESVDLNMDEKPKKNKLKFKFLIYIFAFLLMFFGGGFGILTI